MAYSNYLCSAKPAVGWRAEQPKKQIKTEMFFSWAKENRRVYFPQAQRQSSEDCRGDSGNARGRIPPATAALMIDRKSKAMAQSIYVFSKTKAG